MDLRSKDSFEKPSYQYSFYKEQDLSCSFRGCCYFLFLFLLVGLMVLGAAALIIVFVLRPRKPTFALQALRLDSLRLNATNGSSIYASSVFSLLFNAQNPNRVGISYSPSQLCVLYRGIPVGVAKLPEFYQPAHSKNVSVQTQVVFDRVNVSEMIHGDPSKGYTGKSLVMIRVTGDIKAVVRVLHVTLPKIKVALDCIFGFDYRKIIFSKSVHLKKEHKNLFREVLFRSIYLRCTHSEDSQRERDEISDGFDLMASETHHVM